MGLVASWNKAIESFSIYSSTRPPTTYKMRGREGVFTGNGDRHPLFLIISPQLIYRIFSGWLVLLGGRLTADSGVIVGGKSTGDKREAWRSHQIVLSFHRRHIQ